MSLTDILPNKEIITYIEVIDIIIFKGGEIHKVRLAIGSKNGLVIVAQWEHGKVKGTSYALS